MNLGERVKQFLGGNSPAEPEQLPLGDSGLEEVNTPSRTEGPFTSCPEGQIHTADFIAGALRLLGRGR
jgi:hypothetical protein